MQYSHEIKYFRNNIENSNLYWMSCTAQFTVSKMKINYFSFVECRMAAENNTLDDLEVMTFRNIYVHKWRPRWDYM